MSCVDSANTKILYCVLKIENNAGCGLAIMRLLHITISRYPIQYDFYVYLTAYIPFLCICIFCILPEVVLVLE